jgi:HemY protein
MLWAVLRVLIFIAAVAGLSYGAGLLLETEGAIRIAVGNTELSLSPLAAVIAALVLIGATWVLFKAVGLLVATLRFLNGDETAISRYLTRNRERRGIEALVDGLMAIASGEGRLALAKAQKAERYLNRPDLTNLISAQAAELAGDTAKAEEVYKRLLADDRTRFVGVRGILKQKLAQGDMVTSLRLAEKAFALKPRHEETQDILIRLQAEDEDWAGARKTLAAKLKSGGLPRDVHKRRDALLTYAEARDAVAAGDPVKAETLATEANRLSPDFVPGAALAAELAAKAGKLKPATKMIKLAWERTPHPDLAAAFAGLVPDETPHARKKRFDPLLKLHPESDETRMLQAELAMSVEDFPAARRHMGDLAETRPTARALTIMAAIARGEGATDHEVKTWLTRALTAPRGPQWCCDRCQTIHGSWLPVCATCGAFDTLSYREPAVSQMTIPNSGQMLPLIVGTLEPPAPDVPDAEPAESDEAGEDAPPATGDATDAEEAVEVAADGEVLPADTPPKPGETRLQNGASHP